MNFSKEFELLPFEHHWPESFYEDKMPEILDTLKEKNFITGIPGRANRRFGIPRARSCRNSKI
jgi:hypothetical protein